MRIIIKASSLLFILVFVTYSKSETLAQAPAGWVDGSGGEISSLAELRWLSETSEAWDEDWVQVADINASETKNWNVINDDTLGFKPIGTVDVGFGGTSFTGDYDGQHFIIDSLFINTVSSGLMTGLFSGISNAVLKNIVLTNINFRGSIYGGGIAGTAAGRITQCFVSGRINVTENGGGIVGLQGTNILSENFANVIINSQSNDSLKQSGGLSATAYFNTVMENNMSISTIVGGYAFLANKEIATLKNNYFVGIASTQEAFYGQVNNIEANYIDTSYSSFNSYADTVAIKFLNSEQYADSSMFVGWNFDSVWTITTLLEFDSLPRPYLQWLPIKTIEISHDGNGRISGDTIQRVVFELSEVTAMPDINYRFSGWYNESDSLVSEDNPLTLNGISSDIKLQARFYFEAQYQIDFIVNTDGGDILGDSTQVIYENETTNQVTANPFDGYHFLAWVNSIGDTVSKDATFTLQNVTQDSTIMAVFEINSYNVNFHADPNGTVSADSIQSTTHGSNADTIIAIPEYGYHFETWQNSADSTVSTENPLVLTNVISDTTLTATFSINVYDAVFDSDSNGSISGEKMQSIIHAKNTEAVRAESDSNHYFVGWRDTLGAIVSSENPLILVNLQQDTVLTAIFGVNEFDLTLLSGSNGRLEGDTEQTLRYDQSSDPVEAIADPRYHFAGWQNEGGVIVNQDNPLVFTSLNSDSTLTALFEINRYEVTFTSDTNGSVSGATSQLIEEGKSAFEVEAVPNVGFRFSGWANGDNTVYSRENPIVIDSIYEDISIKATFVTQDKFTLYFKADSNGSISGDTLQIVEQGLNAKEVIAIPDEGYHFVAWLDELNQIFGEESRVQILDVLKNYELTAKFSINKYEVVGDNQANGGVLDIGKNIVEHGDTVDITIIPASGNELDSLYLNGEKFNSQLFKTEDGFTFELIVTNDVFIKPYFSKGSRTSLRYFVLPDFELEYGRNGVHILLEGPSELQWELLDLQGRMLRSGNDFFVPTSTIQNGVYLLRIWQGTTVYIRSIWIP